MEIYRLVVPSVLYKDKCFIILNDEKFGATVTQKIYKITKAEIARMILSGAEINMKISKTELGFSYFPTKYVADKYLPNTES